MLATVCVIFVASKCTCELKCGYIMQINNYAAIIMICHCSVAMPVIEGSPEDEAVELDGIVRLSCFASGVPVPDIKFYHNDVEVVLDSRVAQAGSFLVITRAVVEDQGMYHCEAANMVGTARSNSSTLIVFSKCHKQ